MLIIGGRPPACGGRPLRRLKKRGFAEFERSMVRERTRTGVAAALDRGVKVSGPAKLSPHQRQEIIRGVRDAPKLPLSFRALPRSPEATGDCVNTEQ